MMTPTVADSDPPTTLLRRDSCVELPSGSVVDEIYEIDAKLGAGAMGEVYAARHVRLGKRVAIKVISQRLSEDAAAIERFAMEAQALAQIQHPAIVAVEHVGELADGRAYFVMEYLKGESLFERMARGRIRFREAIRILDQMARGLEAAHAHGVTHRDLKPENVYLVHLPGEAPMIKLLDFGLAKLAADVDRRAERTQSGVTVGTPMYMSPEQARGPDVDYRTDIYALGCVAYELVLGLSPFPHARTTPEFYAAHLHESPSLPRTIWPEIPPQLDLALFAMLAKDPGHRPTLAQVRSVIADVRISTSSQRAATEFVNPRMPRFSVQAVGVAVAALIGGITVGAALIPRPRGEASHEAQVTEPRTPSMLSTLVDAAMPASPSVTTDAPAQRPRIEDSSEAVGQAQIHRSKADVRPTPTKIDTPSIVVPVDAGVDTATIDAVPPPQTPPPLVEKAAPKQNKPTGRNQIIDPFARKREGGSK